MDTNYTSGWETTGETVTPENWVPPNRAADFADILKRSNCSDFLALGLNLTGATSPRENWVDWVRGRNYTASGCHIGAAGISGATIKGAIDGWTFTDCLFDRCAGREIEVGQFDNYWFPGRPRTRRGCLRRVYGTQGKPVRVTLWDADRPEVVDSDVQVTAVPWVVWFPYFLVRWAWVRVKGLRTQ